MERIKKINEEINELENKIRQEESFAMELLRDQRKQNKRLFIILLVVLSMWFITIGYLVWLLNDIEISTTESIDIQDVENIDNSNIEIGDELWAE